MAGQANQNDNFTRNVVILFIVAPLALIGLGFLLWLFLNWYIAPESIRRASEQATAKKDLFQALGLMIAGFAGTFAGVAAAIGVYVTWQNLKHTQETAKKTQEATNKNLELARKSNVTERFAEGITQLGSTMEGSKDKNMEVRLGGIYTLEAVARESDEYHWPVMEVLTSYVRKNSPWQPKDDHQQNVSLVPDLDVQSVLTVVGRRTRYTGEGENKKLRRGEENGIDLHNTDLRGGDLRGANLDGANLYKVNLESAWLQDAHLRGISLSNSHLHGAYLSGADLTEANLAFVHLDGAILRGASFTEATLTRANLDGAILQGRTMPDQPTECTDFRGAKGLFPKQIERATGEAQTTLLPFDAPAWWKKTPYIDPPLEPGEYSINVLEQVALSFEIGEKWNATQVSWPQCLTIRCSDNDVYVSFVNARQIYDPQSTELDNPMDAPPTLDGMLAWLQGLYPYLTLSTPKSGSIGEASSTDIDVVVSSVPKDYPTMCTSPCVPLFYLTAPVITTSYRDAGIWFNLEEGKKNRVSPTVTLV